MSLPHVIDRIALVASNTRDAQTALAALAERYSQVAPEEAQMIVALGGDGLMLQTLHNFMRSGKPIYGMNHGSIGFLMNEFREGGLRERLRAAVKEMHSYTTPAILVIPLEGVDSSYLGWLLEATEGAESA